MISSYYRGSDGHVTAGLTGDALRQALASAAGVLWVDLEEATHEEGALLSDVFSFHHLAIEDCFNKHIDPAKIDD